MALWPGMGKADRQKAIDGAATATRIGTFAGVWDAARELLGQDDENAVSGRLVLVDKDAEDGFGKTRAVVTHRVQKVKKRWRELPVLLLDATLPPVEILRQFFPDIEVTADIEATMPHAKVSQIVEAPTSAGKLFRNVAGRSREAIRRAILLKFVEAGRLSTLIICQLELEAWLQAEGLPAGVATAHFGAISGLDEYKDVGCLIIVGRTMPGVLEVETYAGAFSGLASAKTAEPKRGARFHDRVPLALRMADGSGYAVEGYRHPDPIAEATRWQVAEGGTLQAIGRARAVNRTAANPVEIVIMNDLAMPVTVDAVVQWEKVEAGYEADMAAAGIGVESPGDMSSCWPKVWETPHAAKRWRQRSTEAPIPIKELLYRRWGLCGALNRQPAAFRYQHQGERQKWRRGWHLPHVVADPRSWIEARLGVQLAQFEIVAAGAAEPEVEPASTQSDEEVA